MTSIIRMHAASLFTRYTFPSFNVGGLENNLSSNNETLISAAQSQEALDKSYQEAFERGHTTGYKNGFDKGEKEGYGAGLLKGVKEGTEESKQDLNIALSSLNSAVINVQDMAFDMRDDIKNASLDVIDEIAQKVVNKELSINPEVIIGWIEDSIASLPEQPSTINIVLNDEDYQRIINLADSLENNWKLKSNSLIKPGCCEVSTNLADIKINPQEKIKNMIEQVQ